MQRSFRSRSGEVATAEIAVTSIVVLDDPVTFWTCTVALRRKLACRLSFLFPFHCISPEPRMRRLSPALTHTFLRFFTLGERQRGSKEDPVSIEQSIESIMVRRKLGRQLSASGYFVG